MPTVEDVLMMTGPEVVIASPSDTVTDAARLMDAARVGSVIVKDGDKIVGVFTERDLLAKVVARRKNPEEIVLADVMTSPVRTCGLSDDVDACMATFGSEHIRHLAVVEDGALIGVLGLRDILAIKLQS